MKKPKKGDNVYMMMSGGVDSSLSAALLVEQGYNVTGFYIKCWSDETTCPWQEDQEDARRVAAKLNIPFYSLNLENEYKQEVVDYMIREYREGRTPNPDIMCNSAIKFGMFLRYALKLGADFVATGHYARIRRGKTVELLAGADEEKDQTYFLSRLGQEQLQYAMFPIGDYKKKENVRKDAEKRELITAQKKDSQGICFLGEVELRSFLQDYIDADPGPIVTVDGRQIGEHIGLPFYTLGQRKGIGIGGGIPFYVTDKDEEKNILIVAPSGQEERLYSDALEATDVVWTSGIKPKLPLKSEARIRYRQPLQKCEIRNADSGVEVIFDEPQRAVTSGQSVVFYNGEILIGSGTIQE